MELLCHFSSSISYLVYGSLIAWTFISLQIKEFRIMGLSINDSVYSCLFFFLTGLHFFHLLLGLLLLSLLFWSCSFSFVVVDEVLEVSGLWGVGKDGVGLRPGTQCACLAQARLSLVYSPLATAYPPLSSVNP